MKGSLVAELSILKFLRGTNPEPPWTTVVLFPAPLEVSSDPL